MGAQIWGESHVTRLVEAADEVACAQYCREYGGAIARIGAEVTVAQVRGGEQWRAARDVEQDVTVRHGAVSCWSENQRAARRRSRRGVIVNDDLERTETTLGRADCTPHDRKFGGARRHKIVGPSDQRGDVEMLLEQGRSLDRALVAPVNESNARAFDLSKRNVRHRHRGGCDERGHLRSRLRGLGGPAGAFAYIGKAHIAAAFGGDLAEQRRFLRAANRDRLTRGHKRANAFEFAAAEL